MKDTSPDRIRLMFFTNTTVRGGAEEHILQLLQGLDRERFQLYFVCDPELWRQIRTDCPGDVQVVRLMFKTASDLRSGWELFALLRRQRVHLLHSHLFWSSLFASPVGWAARVPAIVETPHVRESWRKGLIKGHYWIDRSIARVVDRYIAVSSANAGYLAAAKGIPRQKIRVIRPGCDFRPYESDCTCNLQLKQKLGFAVADPVLLVAARLEPQKGHAVLLSALVDVRREFPSVRLVCLSDGTLREELMRLSHELGIADSVRFVGYQPQILPWVALADICVLPSFFEGLPLIAIESLAAGKPMVATAVDGTPEVVLDGKTGLTVPPGDSARLAQAICALLGNPSRRCEMGHTGREFVLQNFSVAKLLRETEALYVDALRGKVNLPWLTAAYPGDSEQTRLAVAAGQSGSIHDS